MSNQKGSVLIVISIVIVLLVISGGVLFYFKNNLIPPQPSSQTSNQTMDPIKNHISFTKPDAWIEKSSSNDNLTFTSPDLIVSISRTETNPSQALEDTLHPSGEQANYNSDIQETTISGLKAISYHNNYEGHDKTWVIAQDPGMVWEIHINSKDQSVEDSHKSEIEVFIESIIIK